MTTVPFHAQDEFLYCGVACGQMLLHWHSTNLGDRAIFIRGQQEIFDKMKVYGGNLQSTVGPGELKAWLNSRWLSPAATDTAAGSSAHGYSPWAVAQHVWAHFQDHSLPEAVFVAMEACFDRKLPCVSLQLARMHWVVVTGRSQSRTATDDVVRLLDPWLEQDGDSSNPRPAYAHRRASACGCGNFAIMSWSYRTVHGQRRFIAGRVLTGWPFGKKDQPWEEMKKDIEAAKLPVTTTGAQVGTYAVVPSEAVRPGVRFTAPRPVARRGPPPDVETQLDEAGLKGAGAPEPWASLASGGPAESREVRCEGDTRLFYHLHFWPRGRGKRQWLAALTTEDCWLLETAIVRGLRPSLAGAEAAAVTAVTKAKTVKLAGGRRVRPVDCLVEALPGLVWIPCDQTAVPFLPLVKVKLTRRSNGVEEGTVYVSLTGRIHAALTN